MATPLQDPLASAAPVLQGGPGALEIGYKRMGIEQEAGKLAAAQKAAADKLKQDQKDKAATDFKMEYDTVFMPHGDQFVKKLADEDEWLSQRLMDYDQGKGTDPNDITTPAGRERMLRLKTLKQWASNSAQVKGMYGVLGKYIDENRNNLKPGTKEAFDEWASNIENVENGKLYDPIIGNIDLNKVVQTQLKGIAENTIGKAWLDSNGASHSFQEDSIIPEQVLSAINGVMTDHYNVEQAKYDAAEIAINDPERYKRIVELAETNKIPVETAVIFDYAVPMATYKRHTETQGGINDAGLGATRDKAAAVWFAEWLKGTQDETYATEDADEEQNQRIGEFLETSNQPENAPGWWNDEKIPKKVKIDKTMNGLLWDKKEFYDATADKNIKVQRDVKDVLIDPTSKKYLVKVAPAGEEWTREKGEVIVVPFDQAESKMGKNLLGFNKEVIGAQGLYDVSAEKEGYGSRKGTGGQNIVKTPSGPNIKDDPFSAKKSAVSVKENPFQ